MKTGELAVRPIISEREAEKMVWTFIQHGNHSRHDQMKFASKKSIENWFSENNEPLTKVIPRCRNFFSASIPFVENFIGSTWTVWSEGGTVKAGLIKGGQSEPEIEIEGPGTISVGYESKFEAACRAREKAVEGASLEEFHTAIVKGISSIEAFVSHRVDIWNHSPIAYKKLGESKGAKVSFEDKIKVWIPIMREGEKLNLGGVMWADFLFLQAIRDGDAIHAKKFAQAITFLDLAFALNKFKTGIADFLLQLHVLFGEPLPRSVIRAKFFPEVYVSRKTK